MRAWVKTIAGLGLAACLGGCTVGSFDLSRSATSPTAAPPSGPPPAEPADAPEAPGARAPAAEPEPTQTYQPPPAAAPVQRSRPMAAARAARAPEIPPPSPPQPEPDVLTLQGAREQCWMASENTKFKNNLEQKVKFVEKCVEDKLRAAGR